MRLTGLSKPMLVLALAAAAALSAAPADAINSKAGTSGAPFLKLGAGSRAGAMAEAYSAMAGDAYALYYNPGALTALTRPQLAGAHTQHFQGIDYEFAGFAYPMGREETYSRHVLGLSIYNLSVSGIERRTEDTNSPIGTFEAGDYAYNLSYAYRASETLGFGATGKFIHQVLDTYNSTAFGADLGLHYTPRPQAKRPLSFALVLKNVGTRPSFAGVSDPLPVGLTAGLGCRPAERARLDLDVTKYRDSDIAAALGGEYLHPFGEEAGAYVRGGYSTARAKNEGLNGLTLGMGISFYSASFDFAWVPFGVLGDTFRYSLLLKF